MSKKPTAPTVTPAPTPSNAAEVLDQVPDGVPTAEQLVQRSATAAVVRSFDERVDDVASRLQQLAEAHPEYADRITDLSMYVAAKIEGVASSRGVPVPNLLVRQAMTKEENAPESCKVGSFYTKSGDSIGTTIDVIPLYIHFKRVKFVQGNDRPECYSDDGVYGSKYGECKTCPYQKFEEGVKAACSSGRTVTCVTPDFQKLYQIDFTKTSSKYGRKLEQLAVPPALFSSVFTVYTDKETNKANQAFYVTKVKTTGRRVTGVEFDLARALYQFAEAKHQRSIEYARSQRALTRGSAPQLGSGVGAGTDNSVPDVEVDM